MPDPASTPSPQLPAAPAEPFGFAALHDALVRTAYWNVFVQLLPATMHGKFREHVRAMPLQHALDDLRYHLDTYPHRGIV